MTHIRLAAAKEDVLAGALHTAWKLRVEKNAKSGQKKRAPAERSLATRAQIAKPRAAKNGVAKARAGKTHRKK